MKRAAALVESAPQDRICTSRPQVRTGARFRWSAAAIAYRSPRSFSAWRWSQENGLPGPESAASSLSEAALAARSLSEFYDAMGRTLPSLAVRGQIHPDALGLGAAAAYRGAPDQNTGLLKALRARGIAPRSAADVT